MKKLAIILVVAALAGAGAWYFLRSRQAAAEAAKPAAATAKAERGPVRLAVASTGRVVSNLDVDIKCRASGEVKKLPFDVSDKVKTGELLFELDPTDMQRNVDRAKAALAQSQARLASARQNLVVAEAQLAVDRKKADAGLKSAESRASYARLKANRIKQTLDQHLSSQDEYDAANDVANQAEADLTTTRVHLEEIKVEEQTIELRRQEVRQAEAQVDADKVALADAEQQRGYTRVVSPIDGVVSARNVQVGTIIASGINNVGGAPPC